MKRHVHKKVYINRKKKAIYATVLNITIRQYVFINSYANLASTFSHS